MNWTWTDKSDRSYRMGYLGERLSLGFVFHSPPRWFQRLFGIRDPWVAAVGGCFIGRFSLRDLAKDAVDQNILNEPAKLDLIP